MTVQELIDELNQIENKSLPVIVNDHLDFCDNLHWQEVNGVYESNEYFRIGNTGKYWDCVKISSD